MTRAILISLFVAAALAPIAVAAHGTKVTVRGHLHPNGPIEITGEDFAPNDIVRIELRKEGVEPIELGRIPADADGGFTETLHIPASVPAGVFTLAADGKESATFEVTVFERPEGENPAAATPSEANASVSHHRSTAETAGLASFLAAIVLAALGLLWLSRTHPRSASA